MRLTFRHTLGLLVAAVSLLTISPAYGGAVRRTTVLIWRSHSSARPARAPSPVSIEVRAAQRQITKAIVELERDFEQSPELRDARLALLTTGAAYRDACNTAVESLRNSSEYRQACESIEQTQRRLDAARRNDRSTHEQLTSLAGEMLRARTAVSKMETKVLADDAAVVAARDAWIDANGKLVSMRREFEASIQTDASFRAAKDRLESSRRQLLACSR